MTAMLIIQDTGVLPALDQKWMFQLLCNVTFARFREWRQRLATSHDFMCAYDPCDGEDAAASSHDFMS